MRKSKRGNAFFGSFLLGLLFAGCAPAANTRPGVPLEVRRGYCVGPTQFKQRGKRVDRDEVMARLAKSPSAAPHVESGNSWAVGSIAATLAAGTALALGIAARSGDIEMSSEAEKVTFGIGAGAAVASWVLCITSDGEYAAAAKAYNAGLPVDGDDPDHDPLETAE